MVYRAEEARKLLILSLIASLFFSHPVYANDDIELTGDIIQIILPVAACGMTFFHDDQEGLIQFSKSFLLTLGTTYALKYSIDKERPNGSSQSFPSGHTSAAFSGASFMQKRYGWKFGIPAYLAASFVGWSRIESDNHYVEDVLAGAAIGIISTYIFTDAYREGIVITPVVEEGTYGMALRTTF